MELDFKICLLYVLWGVSSVAEWNRLWDKTLENIVVCRDLLLAPCLVDNWSQSIGAAKCLLDYPDQFLPFFIFFLHVLKKNTERLSGAFEGFVSGAPLLSQTEQAWESQLVCWFSREKGRSSLPSYASLVLPAGALTGGPFSDCMTRVLTLRYPGLFGRKLCRIRWAPTPREPTQWPTLWLWLLHSSSPLERSLTSLALFLQPTPKHPQVILG